MLRVDFVSSSIERDRLSSHVCSERDPDLNNEATRREFNI